MGCALSNLYDPNRLPPGDFDKFIDLTRECTVTERSAGLLMFRRRGEILEVFLVHPRGPLWAKKDLGAWSVPKGEYSNGEDALTTARREFEEETGIRPKGKLIPLADIKQPSAKRVKVWAFEGDCDPSKLHSTTFTMVWPKKTGMMQESTAAPGSQVRLAEPSCLPGRSVFWG
jgi:predicted NUDIX family NTP pyrophosphohydrolase